MMQKLRRKFTRWYFKQGYPMVLLGITHKDLPWYVKLAVPWLFDHHVYICCSFEQVSTVFKNFAVVISEQVIPPLLKMGAAINGGIVHDKKSDL
jgi:hypothetical protein